MLFDGDLDFERLRGIIAQRMLAYDRFRQVVKHDGSNYHWVNDPDFDLDQHLRRAVLPGRGDKAELERFVADLASTALHPARPLWDMHLVDTSMGGQALIIRFHHCIADGIALVGVVMSLADDSPPPPVHHLSHDDDDDEQPEHPLTALWRPLTQAVQTSWSLSSTLWNKYWELVGNPAQAMKYARMGSGMTAEAAKLLVMANDSDTRFKGMPGTVKRVSWSDPLPLPEVKAVGKVLGCSVNDLLLSSVAGALRAYLADCGDETDGVEVRALVPVNLRQAEDVGTLGNRFGMVTLELPVGLTNPLKRLYETRSRMQALKQSYQPLLTLSLLGVTGRGPKLLQEELLDFLANKASAVMTNVPGPQHAIHIAGARLRQPFFWVPQSGNIGMGVSILSYNQQVQFGLITDKQLVPDPERIVARFADEFHKLTLLVLMEPSEYLDDPELVAAHQAPYGLGYLKVFVVLSWQCAQPASLR
jgi:WS/DGAT/MGAT family acyltransferase